MERRDLGELPLAEGGLQLVPDEQFVLLPGAGPDVGALGQPEVGVAGERDPAELRVDPVATSDSGRDGVEEGMGVGLLAEGLRRDVTPAFVPVAGLIVAAWQSSHVAEVPSAWCHCSSP